jgi:hypothetical protein
VTASLPRTPESVKIVPGRGIVTALYIPDPAQAKKPAHVLDNILDRSKYEDVEIVAEATRFYRTEGAHFSGWVVRSGLNYTEVIPNKRLAMAALADLIADYFNPA